MAQRRTTGEDGFGKGGPGALARALERFGLAGGRSQVALAVALLLVLAVVVLVTLNPFASRGLELSRAPETPVSVITPQTPVQPERLLVHVDGAVVSPGVYALAQSDARLVDAVEAAGGLSEDAETSGLNLASALHDGDKVHVPRAGEAEASSTPAQDAPSADQGALTGGTGGLVNINTASAAELQSLPGVGPSTAEAIVKDREANGAFASPEDLMRVSGIGEKKFAKMQGQVCV